MNRAKTIRLHPGDDQSWDWVHKHKRLMALRLLPEMGLRLDACPTVLMQEVSASEVAVHVIPVDETESTLVYQGPAVISRSAERRLLCCTFQSDGWTHYLTF